MGISCVATICNKQKFANILWKLDKYKITLYWKAHTQETTNNNTRETGDIVEGVKAEILTANQKNLKHEISGVDSINFEVTING